MKTVSEELRIGRLQRRLSQADLASMVGISAATLCRIERGDKVPSPEEACLIAKALNQIPAISKEEPEQDPISKLTESPQRLKIEISLEDIFSAARSSTRNATESASKNGGATVVFYVSLEQLGTTEDQEEEVIENGVSKYPRDR